MFRLIRKIWVRLPVDGAGFVPLGPTRPDAEAGGARILAASFSVVSIPGNGCGALALAGCLPGDGSGGVLQKFRQALGLFPGLWAGWMRGKRPQDTVLQTALARGRRSQALPVRDFPGNRQGILMLAALGNRDDARLAADKLESMRALARLGLRVATIHGVVPRGQVPQMDEPPWTNTEKLLIKPRHGMAARGIFSVRPIGDSHFIVGGRTAFPAAQLAKRLTMNAHQDCLLLQSYIGPCAPVLDLSPNAPAVVRVSAFRSGPGAEPAVASAEMKIPPPDLDAPVGVTGQLLIPINVATGTLENGILLNRPGERLHCSPWNQAPVRGRFVPGWAEICDMVIRASTILPSTPVIGWDVLLGPEGPVIIEANTGVGLFRAMFWNFEMGIPSPLPGALEAWRLAREPEA